jgi:hypothetical protein
MVRRRSLPASLQSAETKLRRADLHKRTARREAVRFFNRHPGPTFDVEPEGDEAPSYEIGSTVRGRIVLLSAPPELPATFSARFGDAIYNYRCVLDHIAWQLVNHGLRWPLPKRDRTAVQFPIYSTEEAFEDKRDSRLPGIDRDALRFIKARHMYERGKATNNALLTLAGLSNDDKHREIRFFLSALRGLQSNVTYTRCVPVAWENPARRPRLEAGAVVAHFSYRVIAANPKVKMDLKPQAQIVDEDWRDFSEMLEGIRAEVAQILYAPQITAAIS